MYGSSDSTKSLASGIATVSEPRLMSQVGSRVWVHQRVSVITTMEVLVWLCTLLCLNEMSVARIQVGCCQVTPEILDDPCCLPYVAVASGWAEADTWWLSWDWGRRTIRFVRLKLKVVIENHAVFVELFGVYKNDCRMCMVMQRWT